MTAVLEQEKTGVKQDAGTFIEEKLTVFDEAIRNHEFLEIDGIVEFPLFLDKGQYVGGTKKEHGLKIINHNTERANYVSVDAIITQNVASIIRALETGVTTRLFGITRIVGYYSRVNNWNRSKKVELADRHKGSYKLSECEGL
jgi:hypothetical protein